MKKMMFALAAMGVTTTAVPASAAVIDRDFTVTGQFSSGPISTFNLSFRLSFDNSKSVAPTYAGITLLDAPANYKLMYHYDVIDDFLTVGTDVRPRSYSLTYLRSDVGVFIYNATSSSPIASALGYTNASGVSYQTDTATIVSTDLTNAVPEPSTWALMILGFGAVGYSMRRYQKVAVRFT